MEVRAELRSPRNQVNCSLRFVNHTNRVIELIWVGFEGEWISYRRLRPGQFVDVNSSKDHPWVAVDVKTKDRLLIKNSFVYFAQTLRDCLIERNIMYTPEIHGGIRMRVYITLPLYTLRQLALLVTRNCCGKPDDVDALELPRELADDLKTAIAIRNSDLNITALRPRPLFVVL